MKIEDVIKSIKNFPKNNSFFIKGKYYSYKKLGEFISDLNCTILKTHSGLTKEYIGVVINEDFESYASCIGLLLLGYGYVPLNPLNPFTRNLEIITQSDVKVILSSNEKIDEYNNTGLKLDIINTTKIEKGPLNLNFESLDEKSNAYIIFTSGSTGKPKGAPINIGNLNSFLDSITQIGWQINENDKFLQMSSMTFDMSILTYILPLCVGACIYTVPENEIKYLYGYQLIDDHKITFIAIVPSTLAYLKPYFNDICLNSVRYSLVCGESFPIELASKWQECVPNANIVNIYGPTEATVFTHSYNYQKDKSEKAYNGIMALGNLVKSMTSVIIDEDELEVLKGEKGELCLSGKQLTSGYLKNPKKTEESFFIKIINGIPQIFYRTGDIVFVDNDDCFYYAGRKDHQVKIQGHRVELGEVELYSREITQSLNTVAIVKKNEFGNCQLHLITDSINFNREQILDYLKLKLPYYMIPTEVSFLDKMPLNINGKIDRLALLELI